MHTYEPKVSHESNEVTMHTNEPTAEVHESKERTHALETKSSRCGFWYENAEEVRKVLDGRKHATCQLKLGTDWIMCPSRVHDDQCEYFCPTYQITIQTPPEFDCPSGSDNNQKVSPGWIPYLAIDNDPLPEGILELLMSPSTPAPSTPAPTMKAKKPKKVKPKEERAFHTKPPPLLLRWEGPYVSRTSDLHENEGYFQLRTYAGQSAQRFFSQAFGVAADITVEWMDDVFRFGEILPEEFEIEAVHIDCSMKSGELTFDKFETRGKKVTLTLTHKGEWTTAEVNIWIALENQAHQPFVVLDNSKLEAHEDVCVSNDGKLKLTAVGKSHAELTLGAPHYSSNWKGLNFKPLRFGGLSMFHGKYGDGKASRFSVDFRFSVPVEELKKQIDAVVVRDPEKGAQYARVLRECLAIPSFVLELRKPQGKSSGASCPVGV